MGGRGSSSGMSDNGKRYGSEYKTLAQFGNIKIVKRNEGSVTAPMETMHDGRIYATVDKNYNIKHITIYEPGGDRKLQIDVRGHKHEGMEQHSHIGYDHDEIGSRGLDSNEKKIVDDILKKWERKRKKLVL